MSLLLFLLISPVVFANNPTKTISIPLTFGSGKAQEVPSQHRNAYETVNGESGRKIPNENSLKSVIFDGDSLSGKATVGTPGEEIIFDFNLYTDKSSLDLFSYEPSKSTSFRNLTDPFFAPWVAGHGYWATDVLQYGDMVVRQPFGIVPSDQWTDYEFFGTQLIGLAQPKSERSFLRRIRGQVDEAVFSIWIAPTNTEPCDASLTFGGLDGHCQRGRVPFWTSAFEAEYRKGLYTWAVQIDSVSAGDFHLRLDAIVAVTLFPTLLAPANDLEALAASFNATIDEGYGLPIYKVDCSKRSEMPPLVFQIGANRIELSPLEYTITEDSIKCYLKIWPSTWVESSSWIIGMPFFERHCMAVDYERNLIAFPFVK